VMGGQKAALMNTDPPYVDRVIRDARVAARTCARAPGQRQQKMAGGIGERTRWTESLAGPSWSHDIRAALAVLWRDAAFYLWHSHAQQGTFFAAAAAAADILFHGQSFGSSSLLFGVGDYHWQHELCFTVATGISAGVPRRKNQDNDLGHATGNSNADRQAPHAKAVELFDAPCGTT